MGYRDYPVSRRLRQALEVLLAQNRRLQDLLVNKALQDLQGPQVPSGQLDHRIQDLPGLRVLQTRGRPVLQGLLPRLLDLVALHRLCRVLLEPLGRTG